MKESASEAIEQSLEARMFGLGYLGMGAAEGGDHAEDWETGEAEIWALERYKVDRTQRPPPSTLAPSWLHAMHWAREAGHYSAH